MKIITKLDRFGRGSGLCFRKVTHELVMEKHLDDTAFVLETTIHYQDGSSKTLPLSGPFHDRSMAASYACRYCHVSPAEEQLEDMEWTNNTGTMWGMPLMWGHDFVAKVVVRVLLLQVPHYFYSLLACEEEERALEVQKE